MKTRSILHIRIDSFCAVVEQMRRADLRGKPVIIGRVRGNTSGVVVSASREAGKFGVEDGMSIRQARRTCPDAIVLNEDPGSYAQVFNSLLDILARYSPLLEPDLLGSAYLDVTASRSLFGDAADIAERISRQAPEEMGLQVSIGIASSKLVARAASSSRHAGIVKVSPGFEEKFLSTMPVNVLDPVSGKIARRLGELGVSTIGQLAAIPERLLVRQFGPLGSLIGRLSLGIDQSQVRAAYPPDVIIGEHTFDNPAQEPMEVWEQLRLVAENVVMNLRKRGGLAGEVMLEMDSGLQTREEASGIANPGRTNNDSNPGRTKNVDGPAHPCAGQGLSALHHFKKPTDSTASIALVLERLLLSKMQPGMEISKVRVTLCDLTPGTSAQLCLMGDGERRQRLERAVEIIRERFGERSVFFCSGRIPFVRAGFEILPEQVKKAESLYDCR